MLSMPLDEPSPPPDAGVQPQPAAKSPGGPQAVERMIVYRHSNLFYWWPVWAFGFIFALVSYFDNKYMAIVPAGTTAVEKREVVIDDKGTKEVRDVLILEKSRKHLTRKNEEKVEEIIQPTLHVTHFKAVGPIFLIILLLVITITNITLRGLWTVLVIVTIVMLTIIISVAEWWGPILQVVAQGRAIYMNMGGYILLSTVLLILWLVNFLFLDRQTYMIFTPGQMRVRIEIGGAETVFDTRGMIIHKERGDLFRHWILGFGSGDLVVKPVSVTHPLIFSNVMQVGTVVQKITEMARESVIVSSEPIRPSS
jgi:hypothetical protein